MGPNNDKWQRRIIEVRVIEWDGIPGAWAVYANEGGRLIGTLTKAELDAATVKPPNHTPSPIHEWRQEQVNIWTRAFGDSVKVHFAGLEGIVSRTELDALRVNPPAIPDSSPDRKQTEEELEVQAKVDALLKSPHDTTGVSITMPWPATFDPRTGKVYRIDTDGTIPLAAAVPAMCGSEGVKP